jgi:uncharacterized protein YdcH (DUF465 family)
MNIDKMVKSVESLDGMIQDVVEHINNCSIDDYEHLAFQEFQLKMEFSKLLKELSLSLEIKNNKEYKIKYQKVLKDLSAKYRIKESLC